MEFEKIDNVWGGGFEEFWKIYEAYFPSDERRDKEGLREYFSKDYYKLYLIIEKDEIIGILDFWDFDSFTFGEHIAIVKKWQGKGFGKLAMEKFMSGKKLVVGEVEPLVDEETKKRMEIFKRMGILLNDYFYIQPPYSPDKNPVELKIMSYPRKISLKEFEHIRDKIHKEVYGLDAPLLKI